MSTLIKSELNQARVSDNRLCAATHAIAHRTGRVRTAIGASALLIVAVAVVPHGAASGGNLGHSRLEQPRLEQAIVATLEEDIRGGQCAALVPSSTQPGKQRCAVVY